MVLITWKQRSQQCEWKRFEPSPHIAAVHGWVLHQVDIVMAFLCGKLEPGEEVYMKQPKGFEEPGLEDYI
jgi:hypothetical protein